MCVCITHITSEVTPGYGAQMVVPLCPTSVWPIKCFQVAQRLILLVTACHDHLGAWRCTKDAAAIRLPWGDHWDQHGSSWINMDQRGSRHITANNQKVKLGQAWTRHPHAPLIWPRKMSFEETGRIWSPMRGSKYSADQLEVP